MRRFVYSPKAYVYVETVGVRYGKSQLVNLSGYVVSGEVHRVVNDVSKASVVIRNPDKMWTPLGDPVFHPMDKITIFLERVPKHPIQVFTGYLDSAPYYQMYPGTCTLAASCTLKKLTHTYVDMALPFMMEFMQQYGWLPDLQSGVVRSPASFEPNSGGVGGLSGTMTDAGKAAAKPVKPATANGGNLLVIGDSLAVGTTTSLPAKLGSAWAVSTVAQEGKPSSWGRDQMVSESKGNYDAYYFSLGTNDFNALTFKKNVTAIMNMAKGKPVFWTNVRRPNLGSINKVLADAASKFSNLHIIDWASSTVTLASDGIHPPDTSAYDKRSELIANDIKNGGVVSSTANTLSIPATTPEEFLQTDGSIGEMLYATMKQVGGWHPDNIYIEALPSKTIARTILNIYDELQAAGAETHAAVEEMFQKIIGSGSQGNAGPAGSNTTTGTAKGPKVFADAANKWGPICNVDPPILMGIASVETGFGANNTTSSAGAMGFTQFMPGTRKMILDKYGVDAYGDESEAVHATALLLRDSGYKTSNPRPAIFAYNHSNTYVDDVLAAAKKYTGSGNTASGGSTGPGNSQTQVDAPHNAAAVQAQSASRNGATSSNGGAYISLFAKLKNPKGLRPERTDQGVDYACDPGEPLVAIGDGVCKGIDPSWFGTQPFMWYQLTDPAGDHHGEYVYYAEGIVPKVQPGDSFTKGAVIATTNSQPTGMEFGFCKASGEVLVPYNTPGGGSEANSAVNEGGKQFARFLNSLGVPTRDDPGPGKGGSKTVDLSGSANGAITSGGGTGVTSDSIDTGTASAFSAIFNFPTVEAFTESVLLTGEKSLMNDTVLLPFIQELCQGSLRNFQSMPNGDFYAFFPDYFGGLGGRPVYWNIDDVEILEGKIDLNDDALTTHVYVSGDTMNYDGQVDIYEKLFSTGVVTINNVGVSNFIQPKTGNKKTVKSKKNKAEGAAQAGETPFLKDAAESLAFLNRYGARVLVQDSPFIRNHFFEVFLAFQTFMLCWARQFDTTFTFTFMPELYPGGIVAFPSHGIQMYIDEVHHSFDYTEGFTTQANLSAPAAMKKYPSKISTGMAVSEILEKSAPAIEPPGNTTINDVNNPHVAASTGPMTPQRRRAP